MLRHAVSRSAHQIQKTNSYGNYYFVIHRRSYAAATSKQKRALSKHQVQGTKGVADVTGKPDPPAAAAVGGGGGGGSGNDGGGSNNMIPIAGGALLVAAGAAAYYWYGTEAGNSAADDVKEQKKEAVEKVAAVKKEAAASKDTTTVAKRPTSIKAEDGSNHVLQIETPKGTIPTAPTIAPASHPEGGSRVTMESFQQPAAAAAAGAASRVTVRDSLKELQDQIDQETSDVVRRANQEVMRSFDESLFEGLDDMTPAQLKSRVMQLATEMKERTRWEALRLKEFLALKERETAERYLEVLQQQRLEFESIMARKLREQEHELATTANAKLQEKDSAVKEMIDNAIKKLEEAHQNEKQAILEKTDQEFRTKYEQTYMEKLEEFKGKAIDEMERKQSALDALSKKLGDLEAALASSQQYSEGSLLAHKLSAAALALAEKMEGNQGAEIELKALKAVAGRDNVITAALESVPSSLKTGVPTLPELQARFDTVAKKTRQAAMVPEGMSGLEGQLAGMVFATLKFPPKPEDPAPENDKDDAEFILVQARQHVQYGELDKAIQRLDKLKGQAAFTVAGWKKDASDRVALQQALKVIKMECALLNESFSVAGN